MNSKIEAGEKLRKVWLWSMPNWILQQVCLDHLTIIWAIHLNRSSMSRWGWDPKIPWASVGEERKLLLSSSLYLQLNLGHLSSWCLLSSFSVWQTSHNGQETSFNVYWKLLKHKSCPCSNDITLVSVDLFEVRGNRNLWCMMLSNSNVLSGADVSHCLPFDLDTRKSFQSLIFQVSMSDFL